MPDSNSPQKLRICLIGQKISVLSRSTDSGLLWPLARGLTERGHEVTIISTSSPLKRPEVFRDGVRAFYLNEGQPQYKTFKFSDAAYRKFLSLHKEKPFHIVHSLDESALKIGRHKKLLGVNVAYDVEATQMAELFSILSQSKPGAWNFLANLVRLIFEFIHNYFAHDRTILDSADGIFVTTPQQRMLLERYYMYPDFHTYTVPYGINLGDLTPKSESETFKSKLNIPENAQVILANSDFTSTHEVKPILKAFEKLVLKKPNTYLLLLGNGPQWKEVEYQMLNLALGGRVIMPGEVDAEDMLECILASPIYIDLSSRSTGLEPSLIEAMAQKKVVIGSELSPISEVIEDKVDGFLVRPADVETLSSLLDGIITGGINRELIGEKARQKIIDVFNRNRMIESLINAYKQILTNSGRFKQRASLKSFFSKRLSST
ncbi:MAG: putative glycosyltransferase [Pseudobdellovibrio sp.]|jgi:glycosyltransferase involved in cell wall biosynthesis|nr:putative glycosyltransferase [Pseudobdellovibrio sp.]